MEITLQLSLEEVNGVLQALGNLPFTQVAPLIDKVRGQATPQFEAAQAAQASAPEEVAPKSVG